MSLGSPNLAVYTSSSNKGIVIFPGDYGACDEGSFFTANLPAQIAHAVATITPTLAKANPILAITNSATPGGPFAYNIYLRYIKVLITGVTTGATTVQHVGTLDSLNPKLTALGTAFAAPRNTNSSSSTSSKALLYGGVLTATADTSAARTVHTGTVANSIPIILDSYTFAFGEPVSAGQLIGTTSLVKQILVPLPPVVIAPGWTYTLGLWGLSWAATAQTYTTDVGWIERPTGQ